MTHTERLSEDSGITDMEQRLRTEPDLSHLILRLQLEGTLPLASYTELKRCMVDLEAAVFHLNVDHGSLVTRPSKSDLEAIDFDGVLRRSADRLKDMVDDPTQPSAARHLAEEALIELYLHALLLVR